MLNQLLETIIQILTSWVSKFDSHAQHVEDKLDSLDQTASDIKTNTEPISDIKDNTGAVITPVQNIKANTDSIATSSQTSANNTTAILNNVGTLSTNTGRAAAFAEDCANNTLEIKDKVTTIASDTTQLRADSANIAADVSSINQAIGYYVANTLVTEDSEGALCSFDTDLEDYLQKAVVTIPADPTGYTGITLTKTGMNLVNFDSVLPNGWSRNLSGITAEYSNGIMHIYGTNELNAWNNIVVFNDIWRNNELRLPAGTFAIPEHLAVRISEDNTNFGNKGGVVTYNNPIYIRGFYISVPANYTIDWYIPMVFVYGSVIPTSYEPYKTMTYPVSFGSTITDGAEADLLSGLVKVNTTPESFIQIQPIAIRTYKGVNNIYSDLGTTTALTYRETLKKYLEKHNQ